MDDLAAIKSKIEDYLKREGFDRPDIYTHGLEDCEVAGLINTVEFLSGRVTRASVKMSAGVELQEWARPPASEREEAKKSFDEGSRLLEALYQAASDRCSCRLND